MSSVGSKARHARAPRQQHASQHNARRESVSSVCPPTTPTFYGKFSPVTVATLAPPSSQSQDWQRTSRKLLLNRIELRSYLGHNWATSAREHEVKRAICSQLRACRTNTGHRYDMPGSHEVEGSNPSRSTTNSQRHNNIL